MKKEIELAKKEGLNYQSLILEEAQTDIKLIIKKALVSKINFNTMRKQILSVVYHAVKDIDSKQLKEISRVSLMNFAERLYRNCLINMGIPAPSILLAYGYMRANISLPSVVKQFKESRIDEQVVTPVVKPKTLPTTVKGGFKVQLNEPPIYNEIAQPLGIYGKDYMDIVKNQLDQLVKEQPKYDKHISLRNIAEMTVRYDAAIENINSLKAQGVNLVQSSRHANCSKRCEPWQGGYYTLDNTYQEVDGIKFQPLSNATDIYYTTKSGKTYKNGHITGFNCRHRLFPYKKGYSQPMVSAKEIEKQRNIDQRMRKYERDVRYYKEQALMYKGIDNKKYVQAKAKAIEINKQYIAFAKENSRAYYPSRTKVL